MKLSPTVLTILFMGVLLVGAGLVGLQPASAFQQAATATPAPSAPTAAGQAANHPTQGSDFLNLMQTFQPGDAQTGQKLASNGRGDIPACQDCHGANGEGDEARGIPRLAGLQPFYLYHQLLAFADGTRKNTTMMGIAMNLDQQQMRDAAAYYGSLPAPEVQPVQASQDSLAAGQQLFEFGIKTGWDSWLPACYTCHGKQAQGVGEFIPPLANQRARYLQNQLQAWKSGARTNDPNGLMTSVAARLSDQQMQDAAVYLNNLNPAQTANQTQGGAQ